MSEFPGQHEPQPPSLGSFGEPSSLGNLRDRARSKNLKSARIALFVAFAVMMVQATLEYVTMENQAEELIKREVAKQGPGFVVDPEAKKEIKESIIRAGNIVCAGIAGMGVIFFVLALLVYRFPLFCTIGGLILYVGYNLIFAYLVTQGGEHSLLKVLWAGILWKIIIIVGLVKGIQSAVAFQHEQEADAA